MKAMSQEMQVSMETITKTTHFLIIHSNVDKMWIQRAQYAAYLSIASDLIRRAKLL